MTSPDAAIRPALAATVFLPPGSADRQGLIAECISSILAGRPLPEALRPYETAQRRPATVADGIGRILSGGSA